MEKMANKITILASESIIEYRTFKNSPDFSYNEKTGAIFIFADSSKWIGKDTRMLINCEIIYDEEKYNLIFFETTKKVIATNKILRSSMGSIKLSYTGFFPKYIKKGEQLGIAILIPKVYSHILKR